MRTRAGKSNMLKAEATILGISFMTFSTKLIELLDDN